MRHTDPGPGAPTWIELFTTGADEAATFYADLFGWTVGEASSDFGGYRMLLLDGEPICGLMPHDGSDAGAPNAWTVYLATPDVDATLAKVTETGCPVLMGPVDIADLGRMAMVLDPSGAAFGLWQAGTFAGFSRVAEPGAPGWFETLTKDYPMTVAFYRDVIGWPAHTMADTDEFRYTTHGKDEAAAAGIMDASAFLIDQTSRWQFYLVVEDADATVARALELGGSEEQPAEDTPYGRIGSLLDPNGVPFRVMQSLA
ncbi:VOC family protein [Nocardioides bruguierae]|uniref:VOC family protein n=1 Tax=Nocardioides bruguierae TaxID=2945102 RepID=UPI0020217E40|nr:VOC family protein [Nocardioides bruguierae]MCL8025676.1 VOC family protein [Nocardioides bruguierae]